MVQLGISSACYYPETTESSFLKLCKEGIKNIEIFFNSPSELSDSFIDNLIEIKKSHNVNITSVHPFMSFAETFYLFSDYKRRYYDSLEFYNYFFDITRRLGAGYFIFHGIKEPGIISDNEYFERFSELIKLGNKNGIKVCQENVVNYKSQHLNFLKKMKNYIGDDFNIVLDIKQAFKTGEDPFEFIDEFKNNIVHLHISDHNSVSPCIPPLEGEFDFNCLFKRLTEIDYNGYCIIELYNHSYKSDRQIYESFHKIKKLIVDY